MIPALIVVLAILLLLLLAAEIRASQLAQQKEQLQEQLAYVVNVMQQNDNAENWGCAPMIALGLLALVAGVLLVLVP